MTVPGSLLRFAGPVGAAVSALSKLKSGQRVLSAIRRLSPDQRGELQADGKKLEAALADLSHALRSKLQDHGGPGPVAWNEARDEGLDPPPEFDVAKRIVEAVRDAKNQGESLTTHGLARAVQAVGDDDGTFRAGLHIAESDGYIHRTIKRRWETTPLANGDPTDAPHVVAIENRIVEHINSVGVVDTDELALFVGVEDATSPEFLAALERALAEEKIACLGWATYGLPPEKLKRFKGPGPDPRPASDEADVGAAAHKVGALTVEITRKLARLQKGAAAPKAGATDPADRLKALAELHDSGVINDADFEKKKAELLAQL